eukprot:2382-Heterococcus_DN1.PRE.3
MSDPTGPASVYLYCYKRLHLMMKQEVCELEMLTFINNCEHYMTICTKSNTRLQCTLRHCIPASELEGVALSSSMKRSRAAQGTHFSTCKFAVCNFAACNLHTSVPSNARSSKHCGSAARICSSRKTSKGLVPAMRVVGTSRQGTVSDVATLCDLCSMKMLRLNYIGPQHLQLLQAARCAKQGALHTMLHCYAVALLLARARCALRIVEHARQEFKSLAEHPTSTRRRVNSHWASHTVQVQLLRNAMMQPHEDSSAGSTST